MSRPNIFGFARILVAAVMVAFLAACGSEGPTGVVIDPPQDTTPVVVDTMVTLHGVIPANGAEFYEDEVLVCSAEFTVSPASLQSQVRVEWLFDGNLAKCEGGLVVLQQNSALGSFAASAASELGVGPHSREVRFLLAEKVLGSNGESSKGVFEVLERPWLVSYTHEGEAFTMERDSGVVEQLTRSGGRKTDVMVSPDGSMIAYGLVEPEKSSCSNLWVASRNGDNPRQLTSNCEAGGVDRPYWFADGQKIAFSAGQPGTSSVANWTISTDGTGLHRVPTYTCPQFVFQDCVAGSSNGVLPHPEGLIVSYLSLDSVGVGSYVITLVSEADGREIRRLYETSTEGGFILEPYDISPDGSMVTVMSPFQKKAFVVRTDGSSMTTEPFSFRTLRSPFFCGGNEWVYHLPEAGVLGRVGVAGGESASPVRNPFGHTMHSLRCAQQVKP